MDLSVAVYSLTFEPGLPAYGYADLLFFRPPGCIYISALSRLTVTLAYSLISDLLDISFSFPRPCMDGPFFVCNSHPVIMLSTKFHLISLPDDLFLFSTGSVFNIFLGVFPSFLSLLPLAPYLPGMLFFHLLRVSALPYMPFVSYPHKPPLYRKSNTPYQAVEGVLSPKKIKNKNGIFPASS